MVNELAEAKKRRRDEKKLQKEEKDAAAAKATAIARAKKREAKAKAKKDREDAFDKLLNEEVVHVSSDESSDDSEELVAKTRRIHNIRMQTQVEDAYNKYITLPKS